jgi:hypothetical protein
MVTNKNNLSIAKHRTEDVMHVTETGTLEVETQKLFEGC